MLNIEYILNKKNLGKVRCQSACYNKFKMGLNVESSWEMAVLEPKEKNSG
jgi:archaellum biogenesis protein FlaJ (TadC family)